MTERYEIAAHTLRCPTWDDRNSVSLPGHDADVLLHGGRDEALEHRHVAPHRALVRHPYSVGLPENYENTHTIY